MLTFLLLPIWLEETFFLILILVGALLVAKLVNWILEFLEKVWLSAEEFRLYPKFIKSLKKPIYYLILFIAIDYMFNHWEVKYPGIEPWIFRLLHQVIFVASIVVVVAFLLKLIAPFLEWYSDRIQQRTGAKAGEEFLILTKRTIGLVVLVLALLAVLEHFQIDIKGLLTVLGVSSLAFALAAQDTLSNMISGFVLMIDRPFRIGDRVKLASGEIGDVYEIGLRSTKFLTFDNTLIIVPNAELGKSKVTNFSYPDPKLGTRIEIEVALGSDIDKVKKTLVEVASSQSLILKPPEPQAFLTGLSERGMKFLLVYKVASYNDEFKTQENLRCEIEKRFKQEKIELALPQSVVHLKSDKDSK